MLSNRVPANLHVQKAVWRYVRGLDVPIGTTATGPLYRGARRQWHAMAAESALDRHVGVTAYHEEMVTSLPIDGPSSLYREARRQLALALGTSGGALRARTTDIWLALVARAYRTAATQLEWPVLWCEHLPAPMG